MSVEGIVQGKPLTCEIRIATIGNQRGPRKVKQQRAPHQEKQSVKGVGDVVSTHGPNLVPDPFNPRPRRRYVSALEQQIRGEKIMGYVNTNEASRGTILPIKKRDRIPRNAYVPGCAVP